MNHCIFSATLTEVPELRTTQEEIPVAEARVEIPSMNEDESAVTIKVTAWRALAEKFAAYRTGQALILQGRLHIQQIDHGAYKDRVAEMVLSAVHEYPMAQPGESPVEAAGHSEQTVVATRSKRNTRQAA